MENDLLTLLLEQLATMQTLLEIALNQPLDTSAASGELSERCREFTELLISQDKIWERTPIEDTVDSIRSAGCLR